MLEFKVVHTSFPEIYVSKRQTGSCQTMSLSTAVVKPALAGRPASQHSKMWKNVTEAT